MLHRFGYVAVAGFMVAEGCGIPLPAETMLVTAAAFSARGTLSIWGTIVAGSIGGVIGGSAGYGIGAFGGLPLVHRFGRRFGLDEDRLTRARAFFRERGSSSVALARFVAFLRIVVPMLAGVTRMPFARFTVFNAIGSIVTAAVYGALGYQFSRDLPALEHHLRLVVLSVVALAALVVGWLAWSRRQRGAPA
jgi:membrane protein DedA with SNARE-associated domain